jgi:hypothetical protein
MSETEPDNPPPPASLPGAPPHPLDLYRLAVQHPLAEVAFIERAWAHYRGDADEPRLLREDFAGTAEVAAAWAQSDDERQAMAIELDPVTATWAMDRLCEVEDLHMVISDVMDMYEPKVDVTVALNFSVLIYHSAEDLRNYLRHAKTGLNQRGLLILDVFGGSGARQVRRQSRRVEPNEGGFEPFEYIWEQRAYDPATGRIDCRIHFKLDEGRELRHKFVYDWRLWRPAKITELALEAGFTSAELWCNDPDRPGHLTVTADEPAVEDWVGYLVLAV